MCVRARARMCVWFSFRACWLHLTNSLPNVTKMCLARRRQCSQLTCSEPNGATVCGTSETSYRSTKNQTVVNQAEAKQRYNSETSCPPSTAIRAGAITTALGRPRSCHKRQSCVPTAPTAVLLTIQVVWMRRCRQASSFRRFEKSLDLHLKHSGPCRRRHNGLTIQWNERRQFTVSRRRSRIFQLMCVSCHSHI